MAAPGAAEAVATLAFFVNGRKVIEPQPDPEQTLLTYLRTKLQLTGTKLGCAEGGCGACTVVVSRMDPWTKKVVHCSVNACLAPVCSMHGAHVITVEGIGSTKKLHPIQERLAKSHGSQCGFCTPGIVMSMYALLRNNPTPTSAEIEDAFEGNLCRCTGYRPILQGFKTFAKDGPGCGLGPECCQNGGGGGCGETPSQIQHDLVDPSKFAPYDSTQELIFPPELQLNGAVEALCFKGKRTTWFRPVTLDRLLALKQEHPTAKIIVGNTEVGIETHLKGNEYPVLISPSSVAEMNELAVEAGGVRIGAAVTLTQLQHFLTDLVATRPTESRSFAAVLENLRWFAGAQIRNVAAVAGNIMTGSPISDLNPIFLACRAKLSAASAASGKRVVVMDDSFFTNYRQTCLDASEIAVSVFLPFTAEHEYVEAFKQARRREDDIAIVNGCIRVLLDNDDKLIREIFLSFGGVNKTTITAPQTEALLRGLPWNADVVTKACKSLLAEIQLPIGAPGGMVEYRRALPPSFFFKCYLMVCQSMGRPLPDREASAVQRSHRPVSRATQTFEAPLFNQVDSVDTVGLPMTHLSGLQQATGEAIYTDDIRPMQGELHAALLFSTQAHANLLLVDATPALAMEGVHAFYSGVDIEPERNVYGPIAQDESCFAPGKVTCAGQIIGVLVADTQVLARKAVRKVVVEYEKLPAVISIAQAIAAKSFFHDSTKTIAKGDTAAGFAAADHVLEGEIHMGGQEHFYLECQGCICVPGEDGEMEVFASTQATNKTQGVVAKILGVPSHKVVATTKRIGGGFGGKETRSLIYSAPVAFAAAQLGRPVRCILDRDEDMISSGGRHPFYAKWKVGFMETGELVALEIDMYNNAGNSLDLSASVMERALFHMDNVYRIPNIRGTGYVCKTNLPSNTAFRGFGGPQGMFIVECWVRDVAATCKLSARAVQEKNFYQEGELTHFNQPLEECQVHGVWNEALKSSDFDALQQEVAEYNAKNRWRKRGLAAVPTKFGIAFTAKFLNQAGALVHIYTDGSVLVTHGGVEMGQGLHTKVAQVAARTLGVPLKTVHISETSTKTVPNASPTAASASSDLYGMATFKACFELKERLKPYLEASADCTFQDAVRAAYFDRVSLSATGFHKTPDLGYDWENNVGRPFSYFTYGAAVSVVEIDTLTGDSELLRTDICMDVGASLNPAIDIGQVEGAFVQGYGLFCLEEMLYSQSGATFSQGPGAYKIPGFKDIPTEFRVSLLRNAPNKHAVLSSKAVGEPPFFLGCAAYFAVKYAISAARLEHGIPASLPFRLDSPASAARIRMACVDSISEQCQVEGEDCERWNLVV